MNKRTNPKFNSRLDNALNSAWSAEVRAALVEGIAASIAIPVTSMPMLSDKQLWEGFKAAIKSKKVSFCRDLCMNLTLGELFAIVLGVNLDLHHLPTGECIGEITDSAGVDMYNFDAAMAFRMTKHIKAPPDLRPDHIILDEALNTMIKANRELSECMPISEEEKARIWQGFICLSWKI